MIDHLAMPSPASRARSSAQPLGDAFVVHAAAVGSMMPSIWLGVGNPTACTKPGFNGTNAAFRTTAGSLGEMT